MPSLSVIMPIYNSEEFLQKAIESVLNQSFKDFELILIDDGSTDNSGAICDKYAELDKRVIVAHQSNGGICAARNRGLDLAQGEYIAFADNDDEYMDGLLEDNYALAIKFNADIVKYGIKYIDIKRDGKQKEVKGYSVSSGVYNELDIIREYRELRGSNIFTFVWNTLFRRSLIDEKIIRFDSRIRFGGEDCSFNYDCLKHIQKMVLNPNVYYVHYRREEHSTITKYDFNKAESSIIIAEKEHKWFVASGLVTAYPRYWNQIAVLYLTTLILITFDKRYCVKFESKVNFLDNIRSYKQFNFITKENGWVLLLQGTKKFGIFAYLYKMRYYWVLLLLSKLFSFYKRLMRHY